MNSTLILIIGIVIIIAAAAYAIYNFVKKSNSEKIEQVKAWLLAAVVEAEKEFGSGTGSVKLSYVYNLFISTFPQASKIITYATFSKLVDEVLGRFENMLKSNTNLQNYVIGTSNNENENKDAE